MTKQLKPVMVNGIAVTPTSAKKRREIDKLVSQRYAKYRRRYPEIRGEVKWCLNVILHKGIAVDGVSFSCSGSPVVL